MHPDITQAGDCEIITDASPKSRKKVANQFQLPSLGWRIQHLPSIVIAETLYNAVAGKFLIRPALTPLVCLHCLGILRDMNSLADIENGAHDAGANAPNSYLLLSCE